MKRPPCVVSRHEAYQAWMSPPYPKAAMLAALDTLPALLKGASLSYQLIWDLPTTCLLVLARYRLQPTVTVCYA